MSDDNSSVESFPNVKYLQHVLCLSTMYTEAVQEIKIRKPGTQSFASNQKNRCESNETESGHFKFQCRCLI